MSVSPTVVPLAGVNYNIPNFGGTGWAEGAGNLTAYLIAISSVVLQTTGGVFNLTADVNFGDAYGLLSIYYKSATAGIATAGVVRLALTDTIDWGTSNLALGVASSRLTFNSVQLAVAADYVNYREVYIAGTTLNNYTGSLTVFNLVGSYAANGKNLNVYVNGILQDVTYDYTETNTATVTFVSALNTGDRVNFRWSAL